MSIIDILGMGALFLLVSILMSCVYLEIRNYFHLKKNNAIIQHNLSKHGITLKRNGMIFHYVSNTHKSRSLYPSEVLPFWYHCDNGIKFNENSLEL